MNKIKQQILNIVDETEKKWNMLSSEEEIVMAISGGKDSLAMLTLLSDRFPKLRAVHIQISATSDTEFSSFVEKYCDLTIIKSSILDEASNSKKNPCFICSRRRNQKIFEFAYDLGIKKVLFGHNRADVIETCLMNMLYSRKISTMMPFQPLFGGKIEVVRPLYDVPEILLQNYAKGYPTVAKSCPYDGHTKREYVKELVNKIAKDHKAIDVKSNLMSAISNVDMDFMPM